MLREQPILAGCLGLLALGVLVSCGAGALLILGGKALVDKASETAGIDGVISTAQDAGAAGFMFNVAIDNDGTVYSLVPMDTRTVTCDDVQALLFPHLTGTLETVHVESQSIIENDDGSYTTVPLTCTWSGWPGKEGAAGVLLSSAPPAPGASAPAPVPDSEPTPPAPGASAPAPVPDSEPTPTAPEGSSPAPAAGSEPSAEEPGADAAVAPPEAAAPTP